MNSSSAAKTYAKMQHTLLQNPNALCLLVEVIATQSQDIPWIISIDKEKLSNVKIRRVSIDKFYERVTGDPQAFKKLCEALPRILDDVIYNTPALKKSDTVIHELTALSPNLLKSLYLLSFKQYEGFNEFHV